MAMGGIGTGRNRRFVAEINVTPLVDVMLVLLIIFMVTAPMMTQGVDIDLPETTARRLRQQEKPLVVSVDRDGQVYLDDVRLDQAALRQRLAALPGEQKEQPIYLRADREVPYGAVVEVMALIKGAGFAKLGMVTRPQTSAQE